MKHQQPISLGSICFSDGLISRMQRLVHDTVLPYQWEVLHDRVAGATPSHCIENFRIAAGLSSGTYYGMPFQDSDLYKWLEAAAYAVEITRDPSLEQKADEVCDLIAKAQCADGYLNTYYTLREPAHRFTNLQQGHELYCAGHFFEAAVAYFRATGKRSILETACRFAGYLTQVFGAEENQCHGYPGHQVVELGLVKLYEVTGTQRYLDLAAYFIAQRGKRPLYFEQERQQPTYADLFGQSAIDLPTYAQTHAEPVQQTEAVGHAVRALYMYSAMADLAALREDEPLAHACRLLFQNVTERRMYVTGAVGSTSVGESFTGDFDLPNDTVYGESCASVALMMFARRMAVLTGEGAALDTMERAFFNQVLGGIAQTGTEFFYVGPLEVQPETCRVNPGLSHVKPVRQRWFDVACCPTNIARTIMGIGAYAFASTGDALCINIPLCAEIQHNSHAIRVDSDYPFGGEIRITALADGQRVWLRQSGHAPMKAAQYRGQALPLQGEHGYLVLPVLDAGESVQVSLDMTPHYVVSHPQVKRNIGKAAVMRGPLVYCAEQADQASGVAKLALPERPVFHESATFAHDGSPMLTIPGYAAVFATDPALYQRNLPHWNSMDVKLIPYYLWANRGEGEMRVYLPVRP